MPKVHCLYTDLRDRELAEKVGERIRAVRRARGLNQKDIQKNLAHYELGYRQPSLRNLIGIADALNVSVDCLLGRSRDGDAVIDLAGMPKDAQDCVCKIVNAFPGIWGKPEKLKGNIWSLT